MKAGFLELQIESWNKGRKAKLCENAVFFVVFVVRVEMWEHRVWGPWTVYLISSFLKEFWPSFLGPLQQTFPDIFGVKI